MTVSTDKPAILGPLRAGIVGAGLMGRWHAASVGRAGGTVVAVADVQEEQAQALARRHSARWFRTAAEMVETVDLDVVHVCTPLATHAGMVKQALAHGMHVVVEKPLAPTAEETTKLLEWAGQQGCLVCPVHQFPFQQGMQAVVLPQQPRLGTLVRVHLTFHSAGAEGGDAAQQDAVVADILPHPLSLVQGLFAESITEMDWQVTHPGPGALTALGALAGATVSVDISMAARPTVAMMQLHGTEGTMHVNLFHGYAFFEPGTVSRAQKIRAPLVKAQRQFIVAAVNLGRRAVRLEPAYPGLRTLLQRFYQAVKQQAAPPFSPQQIVEVAQVRDHLIEQAGLG